MLTSAELTQARHVQGEVRDGFRDSIVELRAAGRSEEEIRERFRAAITEALIELAPNDPDRQHVLASLWWLAFEQALSP